ncbi:MAG: TlpA disulfide reductase family protein [Longimicrobiales bacterium]
MLELDRFERTVLGGLFFGGAIAAMVAFDGGGERPRLDVGEQFPDIPLYRVDGGGSDSRLSDFEGSVVVLNIWATWCPPCRAEMPSLEALREQYEDGRLVVVAVSVDEGSDVEGTLVDFFQQYRLRFPIFHDRRRLLAELNLPGLPTTYVLDQRRRIVRRVIGPTDWSDPRHVAVFDAMLDGKIE